ENSSVRTSQQTKEHSGLCDAEVELVAFAIESVEFMVLDVIGLRPDQRLFERINNDYISAVVEDNRRRHGVPQHFADLRFLPIEPRFFTLLMQSGAYGILHSVSPMSTVTMPMRSPV